MTKDSDEDWTGVTPEYLIKQINLKVGALESLAKPGLLAKPIAVNPVEVR